MELTKDDYDILIDVLEKEMDTFRLPAWYHEYHELKRLRDTLIFIRDKKSFEEFKRQNDTLKFFRDESELGG